MDTSLWLPQHQRSVMYCRTNFIRMRQHKGGGAHVCVETREVYISWRMCSRLFCCRYKHVPRGGIRSRRASASARGQSSAAYCLDLVRWVLKLKGWRGELGLEVVV